MGTPESIGEFVQTKQAQSLAGAVFLGFIVLRAREMSCTGDAVPLPSETMDSGLIRYDAMCTAIAECRRVDEVKEIRDRARAFEVYAKQALNLEAERQAAEIRIRAERKAGELLKEMKQTGQRQRPGDNRKTSANTTSKSTLANLGITRDQSSKWQQLADIPAEEFEAEILKPGPVVSTEGLLNSRILAANPMPARIDRRAMWAWGRLKEFERPILHADAPALLTIDLQELFEVMTEEMQEDVERVAPDLISWLQAFVNRKKRGMHGSNGTAHRNSTGRIQSAG